MRVADLMGAQLDFHVAPFHPQNQGLVFTFVPEHAAGPHYVGKDDDTVCRFIPTKGYAQIIKLRKAYNGADAFQPSSDWRQGGPMIESERIDIHGGQGCPDWFAFVWAADRIGRFQGQGPTPLIAALRALAVSKLGEEVPSC